jgi:hypothetical protein
LLPNLTNEIGLYSIAYTAIQGFDCVLVSRVVCIIQIFRICPFRLCYPYIFYTKIISKKNHLITTIFVLHPIRNIMRSGFMNDLRSLILGKLGQKDKILYIFGFDPRTWDPGF